jgi:hypothetical protein
MKDQNEHLEALRDIRSMMEKSSRFVSLSGFAGVVVGIFALCGVIAGYLFIQTTYPDKGLVYYEYATSSSGRLDPVFLQFFIFDALVVLGLSFIAGSWMSIRKAKKEGVKIWDKPAQRLFINILIPLVTGGIFCIIMLMHRWVGMIAPAMLIFYGLALVNASKYTLEELRVMGLFEIGLGLIAACFMGYGLLCWAIGFGILHVIYGIVMYLKYER